MSLFRIGWAIAMGYAFGVRAELPLARLHSIFPMGGEPGTTFEVTAEGTDLDDASQIRFSVSGISSERKATNAAGVFSITISSNVPPGIYDARVQGRFGISNPRFFTVDDRRNLVARTENRTAETAMAIPVESTVNAVATAAAVDFYKFEATGERPLIIACEAEPFDSKMKPALLLFDSSGQELRRERREGWLEFTPREAGTYLLKVHDLQFRGGKQFGYRLTVTTRTNLDLPFRLARLPIRDISSERGRSSPEVSEQEPNDSSPQKVAVPSVIVGQFYPANDVDRFEFSAKKGDVFWIEVVSERLGEPTDPFVLLQRVQRNEKGEETFSDVQELYGADANLGGAIFNTSTRDPNGRFEAKEDGTYRAQIRDLFNTRPDRTRPYRLTIRRETPDFDLIALITPPPTFEKDKREAQIWSSLLRRNDNLLIKVLALRHDNFSGPISVRVDGLPTGAQASDTVIPEGQNAAWLSLSTTEKSTEWGGAIQIVGKAKTGGEEIERAAKGATVMWDVPDYNNESAHSRLAQELMLATSVEAAPLSIEPKQLAWQVPQATTVSIPLRIARSGDFKQPVKLRAYLDTQNEPLKEWQIDGSAAESNFDLNVKEAKLSTGPHQLFFLAQTSGKIRRVRADEVTALEAEAKKEESKRKEIEERLKLRDVSGIFSSPVIQIFVNPAQTASK